jgi:hypothetical protein
MTTVICWLLIHVPYKNADLRSYTQYKGVVLKESGDNLLVNFYDDFRRQGVNLSFNKTTQLVNENECVYAK